MKIGMSLFVKLLISFILLLIIPVNVSSAVVYYNALNYFKNEIANTNTQKLLATQGLVEALMGGILKDAKNIGLNKSIEELDQFGPSDALARQNLSKIQNVLQILYNARISNDMIRSIYLYDSDDGAIYTSDKVYQNFTHFYDTDWINEYNKIGSGMLWIDTRDSGIRITDESSAKNSLAGQRKVITLVYPVKYISSFNGLLAINVYEDKLSKTLAGSAMSEMDEIMIINREGIIVSSSDSGVAGSDLSKLKYIHDIVNSKNTYGYVTSKIDNTDYLVTYAKSDINNWIFINEYSFKKVLSRVDAFRNIVIIISIIMTLLGIPVCYFISRKLTNPVKKLVKDIKSQKGIFSSQSKNEMEVISAALDDVLRQGSQIRGLMERNHRSLAESYLLSLLKGDETEGDVSYVQFAESEYMCIVIAIDNYNSFARKNSDNGKYFIKEIVLKVCENMINARWKCAGVQYEKGKIAIIINVGKNEKDLLISDIGTCFGDIKKKLYEGLDTTLTIAVGRCYEGKDKVELSFSEAKNALKYRMLYGSDKVILSWEADKDKMAAYYYPSSLENHIFNFLKLGMKKELADSVDEFIKEVRDMSISYDNIIQIINQLIGNIVKHMIDVRLNPSEVFPGSTTMYQYVSTLETLDDIKVWIVNILFSVIDYVEIRDSSKNKYIQQIQSYIKKNYKDEINFEELAQSVGISYSHMRKLFRDELDTNILDYVNSIRIENAKRLLKGTDGTLQEISIKAGFQNIQSFNRFFKKFEGITPAEFRKI